jgi:transcriptional regulator with XRE-family HTH domain
MTSLFVLRVLHDVSEFIQPGSKGTWLHQCTASAVSLVIFQQLLALEGEGHAPPIPARAMQLRTHAQKRSPLINVPCLQSLHDLCPFSGFLKCCQVEKQILFVIEYTNDICIQQVTTKSRAILMGMGIGNNIKLLRKEKGLTQVQLAQKLETSQQLITAYEREKAKIDPDKLPMVAEALDQPVEVLFKPELRNIKQSHRPPRKGSRLSKIQEIFDKLSPANQRFLIKQVESLVKNT